MQKQLRRLTASLSNPIHDRRVKHGLERLIAFEAGQRFLYDPAVRDEADPALRLRHPASIELIGTGSGSYSIAPQLTALLFANSEECPADDWLGMYALACGSATAHGRTASEVLDILLRDGGRCMRTLITAALEETLTDPADTEAA